MKDFAGVKAAMGMPSARSSEAASMPAGSTIVGAATARVDTAARAAAGRTAGIGLKADAQATKSARKKLFMATRCG